MAAKRILLLLSIFSTCLFHILHAQGEGIEVTGTVLDSRSRKPIEFATIMIRDSKTREPIAGTTTSPDGMFSVRAGVRDFIVEASFIGFVSQTIEDIQVVDGKAALGTILLSEDSKTLEEVVVRAERSQTQFQLDKRVFNVGEDLSSTGASALEVLNNVPSVSVNIEGQISLRGSAGVQILINGKPSVLASEGGNALGTITADMIEKVEVITNPSAKYEAAGTSGIINIVLKKEEKEGLNGSVSVNTGIPDNHSVGLSLNRRTNKFNLFSQLGAGYRELPRRSKNINRGLATGRQVSSEGKEYRNEAFYNLILGTDYHINDYNVVTLSGYFAYEVEDQPSGFDFTQTDASGSVLAEWEREETTEATNPKWQYELNYKKEFPDNEEHTFLFSALGNFFGKDQSSEFFNTTTFGSFEQNDQRTRTNFKEASYTFKADYTKPFSEEITLEAGAQYVIQDVSNDFAVTDLIDGEWVLNTGQTNIFEYNQKVLGVYATGAYEGDKWGVKAGLRMEDTGLDILLATTNEKGGQNFANLFPTFHTSYKINEGLSLQAGYSRRIYRPGLWELNPFFNFRNNFSVRAGNPNLQPEFTDSYEATSVYILDKLSMNFGVYYRYTTNVIDRIAFFEDNVSITRPVNLGTNRTTGIEFNAKYSPKKWLSLNADFNFNHFDREGELENVSFGFRASQWRSRLTAKLKLPAQFDLEVMGHYHSREQTVQGERSPFLSADLGLRKKMLKGKAIVNLSVRDVFASSIFENETFQRDFYLYNYNLRGRFVALGFSYGFGKGEAMEFSGRRRH
ncbi:MAG: TonB-dependent receptor [Phaeodactylibacter sp.]|nr:TonB-dependent receptor [Phaeodactylibacter sp.]MCB9289052.1 TonB-dependent receptor [Lewinellaceae bacterium]